MIVKLIYSSFIRFISKLEEIEKFICFFEKENEFHFNKTIPYNASIISIHGAFESFVEEILKAYLILLIRTCNSFEELPKTIRMKHIISAAEFLLHPQKYKSKSIDKEQVINNVYDCSRILSSESFNIELLLSRDYNLKMGILSKLLNDLGISSFMEKFISNDSLRFFLRNVYYKENIDDGASFDVLYKRFKAKQPNIAVEMYNKFIEERNVISHSLSFDQIYSLSIVKEKYLNLIKSIGREIFEQTVFGLFVGEKKFFEPILRVIKIYDNKILCFESESCNLKVDDLIFIEKKKIKKVAKILSIQIDNNDFKEVNIKKSTKIAIKLDRKFRENSNFYLIK
ncbi:hypothetical protein C0585_02110 [Candidatus Woesearchaeota archaeon]|nr:MAG: hypothetical protein C0585_02110 [Candidatus Woesearchaeota archaeon]